MRETTDFGIISSGQKKSITGLKLHTHTHTHTQTLLQADISDVYRFYVKDRIKYFVDCKIFKKHFNIFKTTKCARKVSFL